MISSWLCVDASLVLRLIADPSDSEVHALWERWDADGQLVAAPSLLLYEVGNALHRYRLAGMMSDASVRLALQAASALPVRLYEERELRGRALDLANRLSLSAGHDAHYLALAEWLGAPFWTANARLGRAVEGVLTWVHVVSSPQPQAPTFDVARKPSTPRPLDWEIREAATSATAWRLSRGSRLRR
jgi:predicted nucleic acid-binding protein